MDTQIIVNPDILETTASNIIDKAREYQNLYGQFYTEVNNLGNSYKGDDYNAFKNQTEGFKDDFDNMYRLMLDYADHLNTAAVSYRKSVDDSTTAATALRNNA